MRKRYEHCTLTAFIVRSTMSTSPRILIVDDEQAVRHAIDVNLTAAGFQATTADTVEQAIEFLYAEPFDVLLSDVRIGPGDGLDLMDKVLASWPDTQVILMTGHVSVADAVRAVKAGAADYLGKPVPKDALLLSIERALGRKTLSTEVRQLRRQVADRYGFESIIGASPVMQALFEDVAAVADTSATVLLQGPTGTGKELLANAIHRRSRRADAPFVRINCTAIPDTLLESELFGHEKGAFSGAIRRHIGRFEQADGGTLLLDEIGEIDATMQVKLLRALENGEFHRVGSAEPTRVDVRVIAATNRDLRREVRKGNFREDLFYRLNVVTIQVPSLRDRRDDIALLVDHFLRVYAEKNGRGTLRLAPHVRRELVAYDWPGNVRQLQHVIERAVILTTSETITEVVLPESGERDSPTPAPQRNHFSHLLPADATPLKEWLLRYERRVLIAALREAGGVQAKAARRLGISRSNLSYRVSRLGIRKTDVDYQ